MIVEHAQGIVVVDIFGKLCIQKAVKKSEQHDRVN